MTGRANGWMQTLTGFAAMAILSELIAQSSSESRGT